MAVHREVGGNLTNRGDSATGMDAPGIAASDPDDLSIVERDKKIVEACLEHSAILLIGDKAMSTFAIGKNVFTILI